MATHLEEDYIFECRKAFLPKILELDVMRRIIKDIWQHGQTMMYDRGMICSIIFNRPIQGVHRSNFIDKFRKFLAELIKVDERDSINYQDNDEYGCFTAVDYNEANLFEVKAKKQYDVLLYVVPPTTSVKSISNFYEVKMLCTFSVYQQQVYKKLETILREKMRQHKKSPVKNKVIFLDSEIIPEFHMNLFHNEGLYDLDLIKKVYDKIKMKDVLCIIRRVYNEEETCVLVDIIAPDHLKKTADYLKNIFLNIYSFPKRNS